MRSHRWVASPTTTITWQRGRDHRRLAEGPDGAPGPVLHRDQRQGLAAPPAPADPAAATGTGSRWSPPTRPASSRTPLRSACFYACRRRWTCCRGRPSPMFRPPRPLRRGHPPGRRRLGAGAAMRRPGGLCPRCHRHPHPRRPQCRQALRTRDPRASFNMSLGNGLGRIDDRVFRIGHMGDLGVLLQLTGTLTGVEMGLRAGRYHRMRPGGLQAAMDYPGGLARTEHVAGPNPAGHDTGIRAQTSRAVAKRLRSSRREFAIPLKHKLASRVIVASLMRVMLEPGFTAGLHAMRHRLEAIGCSGRLAEVFLVFLSAGMLPAIGGPVAHLGGLPDGRSW